MEEWIALTERTIGGYSNVLLDIASQIQTLRLFASSQYSSTFRRSSGSVVYGKPGTGKTALALALAAHSQLPYYIINGPDVFQTEQGATETHIRSIFQEACQHPCAIIILDELDLLACSLKDKKGDLDVRISSTLLSLIDSMEGHVYVLGLTSRLHAIDPCFLRSGRLDSIHELTFTSSKQRYDVLHILSQKLPFCGTDRYSILQLIAQRTHGFVPSDLQSLCSQVVLQLMQEVQPIVTKEHFKKALCLVRPSNMNEYDSKVPSIHFSDIYGIDDVIKNIKASVIYPFQHPEHYQTLGIAPPKGILVHGPPGVGKTMLCSALAAEAGVNFMFVESSQIRSKVVGESEANIARLFAQARTSAPCILFIDQIDTLVPRRGTSSTTENSSDRIVTGFLTAMDGLLTKNDKNCPGFDVLIVGATNRIHTIDPAVLRPGRFDEHILITKPAPKQRLEIIKGLCTKIPAIISDAQLMQLVSSTEGWTGAQLRNLFQEAALACLRENIESRQVPWELIKCMCQK
ncbi:P-loop containing nucleoside triphosphate hydrolase protein [Syncephalastrum racemosum]|uniref:P-loop containing nucleoside triphosphate hydrolase protein n=1 Tax=Syncephalastrum racemosum TaxID=13706 RepID=A0A1X2HRN2_SYNRA|nr:P-loop containing nucleoside triphosphate hydrolase protein [Syncephalastrum racemosum]